MSIYRNYRADRRSRLDERLGIHFLKIGQRNRGKEIGATIDRTRGEERARVHYLVPGNGMYPLTLGV